MAKDDNKDPREHWSGKLIDLGAPPAMVQWAQRQETVGEAWAGCERGDWMLWLLSRVRKGERWREMEPCLKACVEIIQRRMDQGVDENYSGDAFSECADKVREMFPRAPRLRSSKPPKLPGPRRNEGNDEEDGEG